MNINNSIMKGLNESIEIEKGEKIGRKQKVSVTPIEDFSNEEIKKLRNELDLTQIMFAKLIGVTKKTVEAWEAGTNSPNGPARRFLGLLNDDHELPEKYHLLNV